MAYSQDADKIARSFMKMMEKKETKEFAFLALKWKEISEELQNKIEELSKLSAPSLDQLYRINKYQEFLKIAKQKTEQYNTIALRVITNNQVVFTNLGQEMAEKQIELMYASFGKLNPELVDRFIGRSLYDGALLQDVLKKNYSDMIDQISSRLLISNALGVGPRQKARLLSKDVDLPYWKSLRLARTEQLGIARFSAVESMIASGVVKGKKRIESSNCCDVCSPLNGKVYDLRDEGDSFHPNCRAAYVAVL